MGCFYSPKISHNCCSFLAKKDVKIQLPMWAPNRSSAPPDWVRVPQVQDPYWYFPTLAGIGSVRCTFGRVPR
jgi:hypothetical protein